MAREEECDRMGYLQSIPKHFVAWATTGSEFVLADDVEVLDTGVVRISSRTRTI
jgi:hypothetical protein